LRGAAKSFVLMLGYADACALGSVLLALRGMRSVALIA